MQRGLLIFIFVAFTGWLHAQDSWVVQGRVFSADSLKTLNNVHIISKLAHRGTISRPDGTFLLKSAPGDSILLSSIGFVSRIVPVLPYLLNGTDRMTVLLEKDTVQMDEVIVRSFYDWDTFKYLFVNMKPIKPTNLDWIQDDLMNSLTEIHPAPMMIKGPVQALYDVFNQMARLQRRLEHNRRVYNEQLIQEGRIADTIPALPDHLSEEIKE